MDSRNFDLNVPIVSDETVFDFNVPDVSDGKMYTIDLNDISNNQSYYNDEIDFNGGIQYENQEPIFPDMQINPEQLLEEDEGGGGGGEEEIEKEDEEEEEEEGEEGGGGEEEYVDENGVAQINQFHAAGYNGGMQGNKKRKWLTNSQQDMVYRYLLRISSNGKLKRSAITEVANLFNLHIRQVQRIWKKRKALPLGEVPKRLKPGPKRIHVDLERIPEIPLKQRTTLMSLAGALNVGSCRCS